MWQAIQYVSSGVTLLAFIAAVGAYLYRRSIKQKENMIKYASDDEKGLLIEKIIIGAPSPVDPSTLTREQRYDIACRQLKFQSRRYTINMSITALIAILFSIVSIIAIKELIPVLPTAKIPVIPNTLKPAQATIKKTTEDEPKIPDVQIAKNEIDIRSTNLTS